MGILNVTPDSFSDGGRFFTVDAAVTHALQMEKQGADLIDIGAESTRPGAAPVTAAEEIARLAPVLDALQPVLRIPISVDTAKYEVMNFVIRRGVRVINDVKAMRSDERIPALLAATGCGVILMHSRGEPADMQRDTAYADLGGEVIAHLKAARGRALAAGLSADDIVVDPGIGFGKSTEGNWELLRLVPRITAETGSAVLIGLSKKSFLKREFGNDAPGLTAPMAAAHALALSAGARFLRVHDIIEAVQVVRVFERTQRQGN